MPGTEYGPGPVFAGAAIGAALRRVPPTCGSGPADPAAARLSGLPPERARHGPRLGSDGLPFASPLLVLVGGSRLDHASPSDTLAFLLASGPPARRWRAAGAPLIIV